MKKQITTLLIITGLLSLNTFAAQGFLSNKSDKETVKEILTKEILTPKSLLSGLIKNRIPDAGEGERASLIKLQFEQLQEVEILEKKAEKFRIKILPVLKLYNREDLEIFVFKHDQPIIMTKIGVILAVSTKFIEMADTDALFGAVAHELSHEFFAVVSAENRSNATVQRRIELACDGVAVAALKVLGKDSKKFKKFLGKLINYSDQSRELNESSGSRPKLEDREEFIDNLDLFWNS